MGRLAPSAISLPRQLGFTRLVLQWCGAGLTADGHQSSSRGLMASKLQPINRRQNNRIIGIMRLGRESIVPAPHPTDTARHPRALALVHPIGRRFHLTANLRRAAVG
jgi:hypothetical protein